MGIVFSAGSGYPGNGVSSGLSRGLIAYYDDLDITREAMGICAIAARYAGFTVFARETGRGGIDHLTNCFELSRRLVWSILGKPSRFFTRFGEIINRLYMKSTILQKTIFNLRFLSKIKSLFRVQPVFIDQPAIARGCIQYRITNNIVHVSCSIDSAEYLTTIYVMNEFCGDFFCTGLENGSVIGSPSGWERLEHTRDVWLIDGEKKAAFRVVGFHSDRQCPVALFWGREKTDAISWAGFEYELKLTGLKIKKIRFEFDVLVREDRFV